MPSKYRVCVDCDKKKSLIKFDLDNKVCIRCVDKTPIDREVNMKDLLVVLDKINLTLIQLAAGRSDTP